MTAAKRPHRGFRLFLLLATIYMALVSALAILLTVNSVAEVAKEGGPLWLVVALTAFGCTAAVGVAVTAMVFRHRLGQRTISPPPERPTGGRR